MGRRSRARQRRLHRLPNRVLACAKSNAQVTNPFLSEPGSILPGNSSNQAGSGGDGDGDGSRTVTAATATNRFEYLTRRRNVASPLADVRGAAGRTRAIAAAIRAGLENNEAAADIERRIVDAETAGMPLTLW